jgi:hypothetical protein
MGTEPGERSKQHQHQGHMVEEFGGTWLGT